MIPLPRLRLADQAALPGPALAVLLAKVAVALPVAVGRVERAQVVLVREEAVPVLVRVLEEAVLQEAVLEDLERAPAVVARADLEGAQGVVAQAARVAPAAQVGRVAAAEPVAVALVAAAAEPLLIVPAAR